MKRAIRTPAHFHARSILGDRNGADGSRAVAIYQNFSVYCKSASFFSVHSFFSHVYCSIFVLPAPSAYTLYVYMYVYSRSHSPDVL